jgi:Flp pilus assembly pilin Flp
MVGSPWRAEDGQATLEWTALVAVVAVVLALGGALAGGPGIVNAVGGALRRAICLVGGGDCRPPRPKACVLSASDASVRASVELTFVKLGGRFGLLRQELSDGTFRLTLVDDVEAGATAGLGAHAGAEIDGLFSARTGTMSEVELLSRLGRRRSWKASSKAEADALARRIEHSVAQRLIARPVLEIASGLSLVELAELPEPDESSLGGELEASGSVRLALGGEARAGLAGTFGATRERDGTTKVTFTLAGESSLDLQRTFFGLHAEVEGSAAVTVAFDRGGQATELEVSAVAEGDAQAALPEGVPRHGAGREERGSRLEAAGTLDLTASDHVQVAERLLAGLAPGRAGELPGAAAELARRMSSSGTLSAELRTTSREAYGAGWRVGAGPVAGVSGEASRTRSRLARAWWRPPGGVWDRRLDCAAHRA